MNNSMHPKLRICNLTIISPQGTRLLDGVSLSIEPSTIFSLVGESGSGKSLTALSIMRLLHPNLKITHGEILIDNTPLFVKSEQEMTQVRGKRITIVFQNALTALNPVMTIHQQLTEAIHIHKPRAWSLKKIYTTKTEQNKNNDILVKLLNKVGLENGEKYLDSYPHQLSGGQLQRIVIAMALCQEPEILIADEPTTALDVTTQKKILDLLKKLAKETGLTILFITHDLSIVRHISDYVGVIQSGKIIEIQPKINFFQHPENDYSKKLIDALKPIKKVVKATPNVSLLKVQNLSISHKTKNKSLFNIWKNTTLSTVNNISFEIKKGETLALVGESGSGKSTTGMAILGLIPIIEGAILFDNQPIYNISRKRRQIYRKKIQIIFQNPSASFNPRRKVHATLEEGLICLCPELSKKQRAYRIESIMAKVCLEKSLLNRFPLELSGGQQQRFSIARALLVEPELVVCDEPTSALDMLIRKEIFNLLQDLQQMDITYLFITHDLSIVPGIAKKVAVMHRGSIVEQGSVESIFSNPQQPYTQTLLETFNTD